MKQLWTTITQLMNKSKPWSKSVTVIIASVLALFMFIGILTTIQPASRLYSATINQWTSQIKGESFLYLLQMENKMFSHAFPDDVESIDLSELVFEMATSVKPNDPRSLLGRELPGFDAYDSTIIVAGEGTNYTTLPIESSAPLAVVLEDREATVNEEPDTDLPAQEPNDEQPSTGNRDIAFIYNSHNRESFLPYLPEGTIPDHAHHSEVNITKVSDRLAKSLEANGIGAQVDDTDIMNVLNDKGWEYWQSYTASKPVVEEALASNKDIQFVFDLHRDSLRRDKTTKTIDGQSYAKLMFVVGEDYANDENKALATELHNLIDKKYPGLSRGVVLQGGSGNNGVYNQDLSDNAMLVEFGGVDNTLEELYRTADVLAEIFSDYYWDAEKVQGNP
ncbi:stage II sporulation protein P [Aquibacillus koreensis]|uniref:Stage II sporulation protein P n=1 Tax=Aquibacillus koreensis TaxID=279446 RepID=A0A9X4AI67_9BACI|nr:stage II sporulation protein P [Aquibacillus koreensis]MCT2537619.1 stage II sporulation protein P [Aquibacillus koreensis]MDC3419065.1 stage II sporulation protein P [Aquibacillus koreensis]